MWTDTIQLTVLFVNISYTTRSYTTFKNEREIANAIHLKKAIDIFSVTLILERTVAQLFVLFVCPAMALNIEAPVAGTCAVEGKSAYQDFLFHGTQNVAEYVVNYCAIFTVYRKKGLLTLQKCELLVLSNFWF